MDYCFAPALAIGILTWAALHRWPMYGDHCVLAFAVGVVTLYNLLHILHEAEAFPLTIKLSMSYAITLAGTTIVYRMSPFHPLAQFPGPLLWRFTAMPLVIASYGGHRHLIIDALHKRYGTFVRIGPNMLSINTLNASQVIHGSFHHMLKSDAYRLPGRVRGITLFFQQTKENHTVRKQIWAQAFTPSSVLNFFPPLERRTWQLTRCIEDRTDQSGAVDLSECISHWAYEFMGDMVFGGCNNLDFMQSGDKHGLISGGKKAVGAVDSFGQAPWLLDILWHMPGGSIHYLRKAAATLMRARVQSKVPTIRDLTSYLLDGHPRTGLQIPLTDLELEAVVAIQGGSDNTSSTVSLAMYFLLANPSLYRVLQAALDQAFPDPAVALDKDILAEVTLLDAVINETLRLGSPWFLPRVVPEGGAVVENTMIPAGTIVALAAYSQQTSAANYYPEPTSFRPERWLPGGLGYGSITNKAAIFSFSSGPHVCVAKNFAMQQMRLCLARLILTFDMAFADGFDADAFYRSAKFTRSNILDKPLMVKAVRRDRSSTLFDVYD